MIFVFKKIAMAAALLISVPLAVFGYFIILGTIGMYAVKIGASALGVEVTDPAYRDPIQQRMMAVALVISLVIVVCSRGMKDAFKQLFDRK